MSDGSVGTGGDPLRGMILGAGYGTRLAPVTDHVPKPLLDIAGRPLLEQGARLADGLDLDLATTYSTSYTSIASDKHTGAGFLWYAADDVHYAHDDAALACFDQLLDTLIKIKHRHQAVTPLSALPDLDLALLPDRLERTARPAACDRALGKSTEASS